MAQETLRYFYSAMLQAFGALLGLASAVAMFRYRNLQAKYDTTTASMAEAVRFRTKKPLISLGKWDWETAEGLDEFPDVLAVVSEKSFAAWRLILKYSGDRLRGLSRSFAPPLLLMGTIVVAAMIGLLYVDCTGLPHWWLAHGIGGLAVASIVWMLAVTMRSLAP